MNDELQAPEKQYDELISSFDSRTKNALKRHGVFTTEELLTKSEIDLGYYSNLGWYSIDKIKKALKKKGLKLRFDPNQKVLHHPGKPKKPKKSKELKRAIKNLFV